MTASKILRVLYILGSLIFLAMFAVSIFSLRKMQSEINRKRTESARQKRWAVREPEIEPEPEPDPEIINFKPETEQQNEKETAIA
jgi:hypothetical protein